MATNPLLGVEHAASYAAGRDSDALGPSDSSDSGSDVQGIQVYDDLDDAGNEVQHTRGSTSGDTDASGTGERASAPDAELVQDGNDILPDSVQSLTDDDALDDDNEDISDLADLVADEPYTEEDDGDGNGVVGTTNDPSTEAD